MKRRDWKIKKLEKDIFGSLKKKRKKKSKYKIKNLYFLRKLYIRRNRVLLKKNLVINFVFYKKLRNSFFYKMNFYTKFLVKCLPSFLSVLPVFFYSKKIFSNYNFFKNFLKNNKLDYFFVKNLKNVNDKNNLNVILFNNKDSNKDLNNLIIDKNEENLFIKKKDYYNKFNYLKNNFIDNSGLFFFNYNLFFLNSLEIYKILIILYLNKLNK